MQTISIKSGTSATITITPKINGVPATSSQLSGVNIYVFFVYQFTNKIYGSPKKLYYGNTTIKLTPAETLAMLGNAEENQKYEIQFAVQNSNGDVIAEEKDTNVVLNITRWEAGQWIQEQISAQ
jgi:hypothetical protein